MKDFSQATMPKIEGLNPEQTKAATHVDGPMLVLAGAGSGKTRIVTYRISHLLSMGIPPSQILAVTFTNKAAGEMKERVEQMINDPYAQPIISTFHSLCVRILRSSISHLGYPEDFVIYDSEDAGKVLKGVMQSLSLKGDRQLIKQFRSMISHVKNQLVTPEDVAGDQSLFPDLFSLYEERMREANALDFDDLLYLTVRLLRECPAFLQEAQEKWRYLLIDEYQDTNPAQYTIAQKIAGKHQNLFVVGDPDQSIYSWRGANIQNILNFEKDYPGAVVVRLEQNYRSRETILDAANVLIQNNLSRYEKNLWSARGPGDPISLYVARNEHDEAEFVIDEIERLSARFPLSEMTIFYRTNFQSRLFEDQCLRRRIPYTIVGGLSFYQRREIKDILAYLRVVEQDSDVISFARTINLPKRGIGDTTIERLRAYASEENLPILLAIPDAKIRLTKLQKEGLRQYLHLIETLREIAKNGSLVELLDQTIQRSGYLDFLREDKETYADRKANVEELIAKAAKWEIDHDSADLSQFLEELTLTTTLDQADPDAERVNLMTLHNGKGLEFNLIFLVGMEEELFPHVSASDSREGVEEERRLCYVGMTRAKEKLYFTAAESRFLWGSYKTMRPSRFLKEIPRQALNRIR